MESIFEDITKKLLENQYKDLAGQKPSVREARIKEAVLSGSGKYILLTVRTSEEKPMVYKDPIEILSFISEFNNGSLDGLVGKTVIEHFISKTFVGLEVPKTAK